MAADRVGDLSRHSVIRGDRSVRGRNRERGRGGIRILHVCPGPVDKELPRRRRIGRNRDNGADRIRAAACSVQDVQRVSAGDSVSGRDVRIRRWHDERCRGRVGVLNTGSSPAGERLPRRRRVRRDCHVRPGCVSAAAGSIQDSECVGVVAAPAGDRNRERVAVGRSGIFDKERRRTGCPLIAIGREGCRTDERGRELDS